MRFSKPTTVARSAVALGGLLVAVVFSSGSAMSDVRGPVGGPSALDVTDDSRAAGLGALVVGTVTRNYSEGRHQERWQFELEDDGSWGITGLELGVTSVYSADDLTLTSTGGGIIDGRPALVAVNRGMPPVGPESPRRILDQIVYTNFKSSGEGERVVTGPEPSVPGAAHLVDDAGRRNAKTDAPIERGYVIGRSSATGLPESVVLVGGDGLITSTIDSAREFRSSSITIDGADIDTSESGLPNSLGQMVRVVDWGFRRVGLEDIEALVPYDLAIPPSVGTQRLTGIFHADRTRLSTGAGRNGGGNDVVIAWYGDIENRTVVSIRQLDEWTPVDPYLSGRIEMKQHAVTVQTGDRDPVALWYVDESETPAHVWGVIGGMVVTAEGDLDAEDLAGIATAVLSPNLAGPIAAAR